MTLEEIVPRVEEILRRVDHNMPKVLARGIVDPAVAFSAAKYWDCLERLASE